MISTARLDHIDLNPAIQQIPEYLLLLNNQDEIAFFNREAERIQDEAGRPITMGTPFMDIVPPERKNIVSLLLQQIKNDGLQRTTEAEFTNPQGRTKYFEVTYCPVHLPQTHEIQTCILAREITSQKVFERKAAQLVHDLSHLIENANAFIFGVDGRGYITDWNRECTRVTQLDKNEVLAMKVDSLIDPAHQESFNHLFIRILAGEVVTNYEFHVNTKDNPLTILLNATSKRNLSGDVVGALFVGQDVTELVHYRISLEEQVKDRTQKLQDALQKEQELVAVKNKFVAIASHEFKMPLNAIDRSAQLLGENQRLQPTERESLANIKKQVTHMRVLLEDILTIEKSELTKIKTALNKLDIVSFITNIAHEVATSTGRTHEMLVRHSLPQIVVESDERLLRNIFVNLLSNAIKFSPSKSHVHISIDLYPNDLVICVRDEGIGIPESDMTRIFEPFNRGSNAADITGTGLGLSIARKAVDALNGTLTLESKPNEGTQITTRFPL